MDTQIYGSYTMKINTYKKYNSLRNFLYNIESVRKIYSFFMSDIPDKKASKLLNKYGFESLNILVDIFDSLGVVFFCEFGTLLGLIRENGFIPHDNDLDLGVLKSDKFSWKLFENNLLKRGLKKEHSYKYDGQITEQTYRFPNGLTVDFFLYEIEGNQMHTFVYYKDHKATYEKKELRSVKKLSYPLIEGYKKISVNGCVVPVPVNPEEHLEAIYGTGWRIPDPDYVPDRKQNIMPLLGEKI